MTCNNVIINGVSPVFSLKTTAWKEFSVMEDLFLPAQKPDMKKINSLNIEAKITDFEVVRTPLTNANHEGIISTGYKLIVRGKLIQYIEYIADVCEQSSHSAHFEVPFCTYVVLPDYYEDGNSISVNALVEDVYISQSSKRAFFKNVTMFVYADVCCGISDTILPTIDLLSESTGVTIDDLGLNTFNVSIYDNFLPSSIIIYSKYQLDFQSDLPKGYSFSNNALTIDEDALDASITLHAISSTCNVPFIINVKILTFPDIVIMSQTPNNLNVEKLDTTNYNLSYYASDVGIATFALDPYEQMVLTCDSPDGCTFTDNMLTVDKTVTDATLSFVPENSPTFYPVYVNLNVSRPLLESPLTDENPTS